MEWVCYSFSLQLTSQIVIILIFFYCWWAFLLIITKNFLRGSSDWINSDEKTFSIPYSVQLLGTLLSSLFCSSIMEYVQNWVSQNTEYVQYWDAIREYVRAFRSSDFWKINIMCFGATFYCLGICDLSCTNVLNFNSRGRSWLTHCSITSAPSSNPIFSRSSKVDILEFCNKVTI